LGTYTRETLMPPTKDQAIAAVRKLMDEGASQSDAVARVRRLIEQQAPQPPVLPAVPQANPNQGVAAAFAGQVMSPEAAGMAGAPERLATGIAEAVPDIGKDLVADTAAGLALGPAGLLGGPLAMAPARKVARQAIFGDVTEKTVPEQIKSGMGEGTMETGVGLLLGGIPGGRAVVGSVRSELSARMSRSKMVDALSKQITRLVEKGGTVEAQKAAASRLFKEAEALGGPALNKPGAGIPIDPAQAVASKFAAEPETRITKLATKEANIFEQRKGGARMSIRELQDHLAKWGDLASNSSDKLERRQARMMLNAYRDSLTNAVDDPVIKKSFGAAAEILGQARVKARKAFVAEDLRKVLFKAEDVTSIEKHISPGKFAQINSGPRREAIERLMRDDPEQLVGWRAVVDASKILARKGNRWLPKQLQEALPSPAIEAMRQMTKSKNVMKIFADAGLREEFMRIINPPKALGGAEKVGLMITQLAAKLGDDNPKIDPQISALGGPPGSVAAVNKNRFEEARKARERVRASLRGGLD
jgi:hypothetical protein